VVETLKAMRFRCWKHGEGRKGNLAESIHQMHFDAF